MYAKSVISFIGGIRDFLIIPSLSDGILKLFKTKIETATIQRRLTEQASILLWTCARRSSSSFLQLADKIDDVDIDRLMDDQLIDLSNILSI